MLPLRIFVNVRFRNGQRLPEQRSSAVDPRGGATTLRRSSVNLVPVFLTNAHLL
jgi:hypothetical protein